MHTLAEGRGSIVCVSSITATRGALRGLPYVASKGGIDAMTRTLALEWADRGVRVSAVSPGYTETALTEGLRLHQGLREMILGKTPMMRLGRPEEIAALIAFLGSDAASFIAGQIIGVDGGMPWVDPRGTFLSRIQGRI